tara:strand:+ start:44 stop:634 length:591 start_codon:yes stop_codon:yes gene_type:complete
MSDLIKIAVEDADAAQLFYFATHVLGLEVKAGTNGPQLRAKIETAAPGTKEIEAPPAAVRATAAAPVDPATKKPRIPAGRAGQHYSFDPKVTVRISPTSEQTRPRDVQLAVNGDVVICKRGEPIALPYRHYLALNQAVEMVGRDTGEIHPQTGLPIIEFIEQHSYPFQELEMPSDEEIAAWHVRVDDASMDEKKAA